MSTRNGRATWLLWARGVGLLPAPNLSTIDDETIGVDPAALVDRVDASTTNARVLASAEKQGLSLLTRDKKLQGAATLLGIPLEVHGFKAVRFEWTDGVLDIESDFVAVQKGRILEITYAAEPERIDGKVRQHRELARTLGRFIDIDFLVQHAARG